jgi:pimeloyl-ACP methyl ester carboxylesterase
MDFWRRIRLAALAGAVVPLIACQSGGFDAPTQKTTNIAFGHPTSYEPVPCWFEVRARHPISCGQLIVPEDWTAVGSRQLHLPVVIFHTASGRTRAEPIAHLSGGPGGHSGIRTDFEIERWIRFLDGEPWTRAHDVIVFAQRGTAWADSDLSCPELSDPMIWVNAGEAPGSWVDWRQRMPEAVIACRQQLAGQGHVLGAYNTTQSARDVAALRPLLGLESWALYGVSYGTRYALAVMRDHPEGIKSAILDSPYPPQLATLGNEAAGFMHSLNQVLDACTADALCRSHYPNLRADLATTLARLRTAPMQLPVTSRDGARTLYLQVDDVEVVDALLTHLRSQDLIEEVPNLIEEIKERPQAFAAGYRDFLFEDPEREASEGAYISIFCNDEYAALEPNYWDAEARRHPLLKEWLLSRPSTTPCELWPVSALDPRDRQPVVSEIPTLILAGALDPATPVEYARATAATLRRAHFFVFPGVSHGVLAVDVCASDVVDAFLAQPEVRPKVECPGARPEFSPSVNARAMALLDQGDGVQAEQLLRELLAAQEKTLDATHRNLGITFNSLGRVYFERGSYDQAEPMFKKALAINRKARAPSDPEIALSAFYLAAVYQAQGRGREAEPLYQQALRIEEVAYGPAHRELVTTLETYAGLLRELGRSSEARNLESRAAAIEKG